MKKFIIVSIVLITLGKSVFAQEQLTLKQQADKLYERYEYANSLNLYLKLANKNRVNVTVLERIAECYYRINRYQEAEQWYGRVNADAKAGKSSHYYYAEVLLRNQKFENSKTQYKRYYAGDGDSLNRKLATCDSAATWMKHPSGYQLKNEDKLNTAYSDWGLSFAGNANIFVSDRIINNGQIDNRTGNDWFKLYQVTDNQINELAIQTDSSILFKDSYHTGPIVFNKTADTAYITITTEAPVKSLPLDKTKDRLYSRRLQLLMAANRNGQWVIFKSFPYNNVRVYSLGNAALSRDGRTIYFTSDMPGGEGKTDIWYCEKLADGNWGQPINCGKNINTKEEETFPVISGDRKLYFSSKGHAGMGGYDIFVAAGERNHWGQPFNLKYPVNSTSDDFYLVTNDGINGYLSSNREGGKGSDDLYGFSYKKPDTVPINIITHIGTPLKSSEDIVLKPVYYDLDKFNIRPDAADRLDKIIAFLKQRQELKIEVASYTDSRAPGVYNQALSERRSASVLSYLLKKGIAAERLVAKAYGENNLVNQCANGVTCTEAEQQLNRRTEFKVID